MHRTLNAAGYDFAYTDVGQGEPVVLVHGSLLDYRYWAAESAALATDYRIIVLSRRYHWPNKMPVGKFSYTSIAHTNDLIAFLAALGLGPVHLLGHSYGGYMVAQLAILRPDLVKSLLLAEPGGPVEGQKIGQSRVEDHNKAADLIRRGHLKEGVAHFMDTVCLKPVWQEYSRSYQEMTIKNAYTVPEQVKEIRKMLKSTDFSSLSCKTLLVGGANTPSPFPETLDRLEQLIPKTTRVTIESASHLTNLDQPETFNQTVRHFLNGL